jgi:penicillin amidase
LSCLSEPATVHYDAKGIPHIDAKTWEDAYRVLGALHVRERAMQMEFNRRVGSGTLAELIGPGGVESDQLAGRLGGTHRTETF